MGEDEKNIADKNIIDIEEEGGEVEEAPASTSPTKIIKILFYVVGAVIVFFLIIGISYIVAKNVQEQKYSREQAIVVAPPPPPLAHFDLPSFSVTTKDAEPHFVKITFSLGYEDSIDLNAELIKRTPQLQHIINVLLSGKQVEELDTVEDKINLLEELKAHLNVILVSGKIKEVYFREVVIN